MAARETERKRRNPLVMLIGAAVDLFMLGIVIMLIAHYTIGERSNLVALANNLLHLLLLLTPVALLVGIGVRRWRAVGLLLFPLGVGIFHYTPMFIPTVQADATGTPFTVMSYNLLARANDDELQEAMTIILDANADVVLLQEVGFPAERAVTTNLAEAYPHIALHAKSNGTQGQGVLSRYPIVEDEYWQSDVAVALGHQRVLLDVDGAEVVIYNLHPVHPGMTGLNVSMRGDDLATVFERAQQDPDTTPILIAGDMNFTPFTRDYNTIRQLGFNDAYYDVGSGFGFTFPADFAIPMLRLDYVFYDAQWRALDAQVIRQNGYSDHFPLFVELEILQTE